MSKFNYTVTAEDEGLCVKDIVRHRFSFSSRLKSKLKRNDLIFLNGEKTAGWLPVHEGDAISIEFPEERSEFPPEPIPISPVYEDDDLLIINKQPGYVVHPTKGQPCHTMANGIMQYMLDTGQSFKIRFVNRLDRDTSGLMVVAKNSHTQNDMARQMRENHINKRYIAIVKGIIEEESGMVDVPIGRPDQDKVERGVMLTGGHPSVTHYKVLQRYPAAETAEACGKLTSIDTGEACGESAGYTMVELLLETGRTHQIRVHMSYIGHPVAGDHLYGGLEGCSGAAYDYNKNIEGCERDCAICEKNLTLIKRQALHAKALSFTHPISGELVEVEAPLPADMLEFIEKITKSQA